jgi:SNF2 family DNA or RNA helicase
VFVTYGIVREDMRVSDQLPIFTYQWRRIILDECHTIKNPGAQVSKAVKKLKTDYVWGVSGTPVQGTVKDIQSASQLINGPDHIWSNINYLKENGNVDKVWREM